MIGAKKSKAATRRLRVHHLKSGGPAAVPLAGDSYGFDIAGSSCVKRYNVNDHRAAAIDLQAEKAARPAAPCATYCYHAVIVSRIMFGFHRRSDDSIEFRGTTTADKSEK